MFVKEVTKWGPGLKVGVGHILKLSFTISALLNNLK
jgi:hypothetical protein